MGSRSTARRIAMQAVFQADLSNTDIDTAINNLFDDEEFTEDAKKFALLIAKGVEENKPDLDSRISAISKNWSIDRISPVDRSILRIAIYELTAMKDTPKAVVINEALELAKKYSDEDSPKFINGILGKFVV
jgi:transcription antitermination protein NusB